MEDIRFVGVPERLAHIERRTEELQFSMASEPLTGSLLRTLAASKPGGRLLELGTGTGLCTAWLLDGMDPDSTLVSVDVDPEVQAVARTFLGGDARLQIVTADAADFLRRQR